MAQKILGIDLGTHSLKLVLLERSFSEIRLVRFIEQPLTLQTRLPHEELVKIALEQALQAGDFSADVVSASLPGHILSSRILEFPFTNAKKLAQVIEFELEGYVPFAIEDLHYDFHIVEKSDNTSKVLCVYLKSEKFSSYLENLMGAGVDPKYFGVDVIDLTGAAQIAMVPQDDTYALCDIGHSKTNVLIMHGRELKYARTIGIGGLHFTRAIQRTYNVNFEKAESLKLSRGKLHIREENTDQIARILTHVAGELVSNVKQTFLGFDNLAGRKAIPAIYLTGGGSKLSGLSDFFSFHLRMNVLEFDVIAGLQHDIEAAPESSHILTQAIANAARPIFSNRLPKINLRRGAFAFKQDLQVLTTELKSVGVMALIILFLSGVYYLYSGYYYDVKKAAVDHLIEKSLDAEFKDLKDQIVSSSTKDKKSQTGSGKVKTYLSKAKSKLNDLKKQIASVSGEGDIPVLAAMQEISKLLPAKADLYFEVSEFNYSAGQIKLGANTNDPLNVPKVVAALSGSELFKKITASDPQIKPGNLWDFSVTIDFKSPDTAVDTGK